jgi:hypothetical protein
MPPKTLSYIGSTRDASGESSVDLITRIYVDGDEDNLPLVVRDIEPAIGAKLRNVRSRPSSESISLANLFGPDARRVSSALASRIAKGRRATKSVAKPKGKAKGKVAKPKPKSKAAKPKSKAAKPKPKSKAAKPKSKAAKPKPKSKAAKPKGSKPKSKAAKPKSAAKPKVSKSKPVRKAPKGHAAQSKWDIERGQDGKLHQSRPNGAGVFRWIRLPKGEQD